MANRGSSEAAGTTPAGDPAVASGRPSPSDAGSDAVVRHFDAFAGRYDEERFATSYGRYVHAQERRLLRRWLRGCRGGKILDIPCGTGRLLEFGSHGVDASSAMLEVARRRHPDRVLRLGRAEERAFADETFDAMFCLHLFMHLSPLKMAEVIEACRLQLRRGGILIFDFPSAVRRRLTGFRACGWHGGNAPARAEVDRMLGAAWVVREVRSTLFFPVHRLPHCVRPWLRPLDDLVGCTPLRWWASYLVYCVERCR